mmetsp:Transcript_12600/g.21009  ORF Transcript_12600/g.21009 Transcript_12600/m.21009 type:complete len:397 (+) Transcript_12600:147-1337(+)|eukprot:CAMPEP_0119009024 /NCGR_PEP_ID=MMETSP1176-20130426/4087_1 /TAXON_ID=265551 /ORGANISM="Synedropsis recta cf, Strain CCMP1620" /LENGTH=396 /DNA_ID=CAMNT_0006961455 /DNA_START=105 /DNA_END=1295 /DNA_ORIENTATION=+
MTITFRATSNDVQPLPVGNRDRHPIDMHEVMQTNACFKKAFAEDRVTLNPPTIIQSSITTVVADASSSTTIKEAIPASRGFISSVLQAYNSHYDLVLRPDDVWQAILAQFSFYVNANAETLRDKFVDFEGKKALTIFADGTLFTVDFGNIASRMVDEQIATNIKDPSVTEWLLPKFTTTTSTDRIAASVTIMSTLQAYFSYSCHLMCGIPNVTLEGTPDDWRLLREKIDRLPSYDVTDGNEQAKPPVMKMWHSLLSPVLDQFIKSSEGNVDLPFWDTVCSHHGGGSGPSYLSGWVTVFGCFRVNGQWQGGDPVHNLARRNAECGRRRAFQNWFSSRGPAWPFIETSDIPAGVVSVPMTVNDNGAEYKTQLLAGQFAYELDFPTVKPRTDWCIAYNA